MLSEFTEKVRILALLIICNCTEILVDNNEAFVDEFEVDDAKTPRKFCL